MLNVLLLFFLSNRPLTMSSALDVLVDSALTSKQSVVLNVAQHRSHSSSIAHVGPKPDVLEEKRHQELLQQSKQSLNDPVGVLAIHIKEVELFNLNPSNTMTRWDFSVYIRLQIGCQIKCSCVYDGVVAPTKIIFDTIKHFSIQISPTRPDPSNFLRIEVVAFDKDKPSKHHILAMKEVHIYELMKTLCDIRIIDMYQMEKSIAKIDVEFCFAYGIFGYGYSNQFENRKKTPNEQTEHSLFFREPPPHDRIDSNRYIMKARPVGHPAFINFDTKVEIGDLMNEYKSEMSMHDWQKIEEPVLLVSRMKKQMHRLQSEYNAKDSRRERIAYLKNLVYNNAPSSDINKGIITIPENFKLPRRQHRGRHPSHSVEIEDQLDHQDSDRDLASMAEVIEKAPGIIERIRNLQYQRKHGNANVPKDNAQQGIFSRMLNKGKNMMTVKGSGVPSGPSSEPITPDSSAERKDSNSPFSFLRRRKTPPASEELPLVQVHQVPPSTTTIEPQPGTSQAADLQDKGGFVPLLGKGQADQRRKSSLDAENGQALRKVSFLERAAVQLRNFIAPREEETESSPKLTITPSTPTGSDEEDI